MAEKIRSIRKAKGLTLAQLGEKVNLSSGLLSRIENNQSSPPIATLAKIAQGLEVPIGYFFKEEKADPEAITITRPKERQNVVGNGNDIGFTYHALGSIDIPHRLEAFVMRHPPGESAKKGGGYFEHSGEEFLFVLKGEMALDYGSGSHNISEGDAVHFDPSVSHRARNVGGQESECLVILVGDGLKA